MRHLRQRTTTRPLDYHPFDWAVRFATESAGNHALLAEAITKLVTEAIARGELPGGPIHDVMILAGNAQIVAHGSASLAWLDANTSDWSDADVDGLLNVLFTASGAELTESAGTKLRALAARPGCFDTGLALMLTNWPWEAATLIGESATEAWDRGETELAQTVARVWAHELVPYQAEVLHALSACPASLQAAHRDAIAARFPDSRGDAIRELITACDGGEISETRAVASRLVETFLAFSRAGNAQTARLVVHPRDLPDHAWAAQAHRDQAAVEAYVAAARRAPRPTRIGAPDELAHSGDATLYVVRAEPPTARSVLVHRVGHRFKIGLERPA